MFDELEPGEENVYSEESREDQLDDDEISPQEEAFMKGYDDADEDDKDDDDDEKESDDDSL